MDRLVKADVKEVKLLFNKGQKISTSFTLTNLMHSMSVAVYVTTSNPSVFSITNPLSVISPLSSSSCTLFFQPSDEPLLSAPPDMITVRSSMISLGQSHPDDLRPLFAQPGAHVFRDASILISFVGPEVVRFLISHPLHVPELAFLLGKAISGCSKPQLKTLLTAAVLSGKAGLVSGLIDAGADVNVKDSQGRSLLSTAVRAGSIEVVKAVIASSVAIDTSVDRVLHFAAEMNRVDLIQLLISSFRDMDVNWGDSEGRTPIHVASSRGHVDVIRFCVSAGGNPAAVDHNGWTPLHWAASQGHLESVRCLLECSNVKYAVNNEGKTAFVLAVENGHSGLFTLLHLQDVLHRAARVDDVHGLKSCLAEGAEINGKDQNGWTPLHRAAFKGKMECVKVLLEHGAEVDAVDDAGYTPLQCAVEAGFKQVALLLVAHGAKPNLKKILAPFDLDSLQLTQSPFSCSSTISS